jgi:outer membrane protein OmpA-like peptidoglycan-associated protein
MNFNIKRTTLAVGLLAGCAALMAPGLSANAQNLAAAAPSTTASNTPASNSGVAKARPGYVVFFEQNSAELSPTANGTIRLAAEASRKDRAHIIRIVGRADHAAAVKQALVLQGVLPTSIVLVGRDDNGPIVRASTGGPEPIARRVLIAF